jgi:ferric-dicitrate binding protein FerR (iron transport regulator)
MGRRYDWEATTYSNDPASRAQAPRGAESPGTDPSAVLEEATYWLARLEKGLSSRESRGLRGWIAASALNRKVFFEMAELYDDMNAISRSSGSMPIQADESSRPVAPATRD